MALHDFALELLKLVFKDGTVLLRLVDVVANLSLLLVFLDDALVLNALALLDDFDRSGTSGLLSDDCLDLLLKANNWRCNIS